MKKKHIIGALILLGLAGIYIYLETQTAVLDVFSREKIRAFLAGYGAWAPLVFIGILAVAVVFSQIPNIPLAMSAGAIWGSFHGFVYSLTGALLGGCLAFFISRLLGRDIVKKLIGEHYEFIEDLPEKNLAITIFVLRLLPFLSFDVISYGAGLTKIKFRRFFLATLLGMMPGTFLFAYMGETLMVGEWISWILTAVVLAAMLAIPYFTQKKKFIRED